jgi:hypothetical protein
VDRWCERLGEQADGRPRSWCAARGRSGDSMKYDLTCVGADKRIAVGSAQPAPFIWAFAAQHYSLGSNALVP